ncbi:MAG: histidine ammonia-lyase [Candidatus Cloacimonetes bacterium]|nr:histidine ammonia-lyase [Candidatus Cloacimonadota bacterium]
MITLNGNDLTLADINNVARQNEQVNLAPAACDKVNKCREFVEKLVREGTIVYGLTTGFGKFSNITIPAGKLAELQKNLILSHATGIGPFLGREETRAAMLLRANVLAKGHSGARLCILELIVNMLNNGIHPLIPEKGSVGASGDLAPLSHLVLVMLGRGQAEFKGKTCSGRVALTRAGLKPVILQAKEGLALNNGTQIMTSIIALSLLKAINLAVTADICAALSADALLSTPDAFSSLIHNLRPYPGQLRASRNISNLLQNSELRKSHLGCKNVQDPYSIRCAAQVHGAVRDSLEHVRSIIETEINSATDNPLIFPVEGKVLSGGNFHGEPVAFAGDILGFSVSELGNIAERRCEQLLNPALNRGLKPFLAPRPGLDSGFMISQLTAASLVSENKILAHPASVDSIPTSANQEDHVSMGPVAAVKARNIMDNTAYVLAIELIIACQALEERKYSSSPALMAIKEIIRDHVKPLTKDRELSEDIEKMKKLVESEILADSARKYITLE